MKLSKIYNYVVFMIDVLPMHISLYYSSTVKKLSKPVTLKENVSDYRKKKKVTKVTKRLHKYQYL